MYSRAIAPRMVTLLGALAVAWISGMICSTGCSVSCSCQQLSVCLAAVKHMQQQQQIGPAVDRPHRVAVCAAQSKTPPSVFRMEIRSKQQAGQQRGPQGHDDNACEDPKQPVERENSVKMSVLIARLLGL